jgi:hypothetical protein
MVPRYDLAGWDTTALRQRIQWIVSGTPQPLDGGRIGLQIRRSGDDRDPVIELWSDVPEVPDVGQITLLSADVVDFEILVRPGVLSAGAYEYGVVIERGGIPVALLGGSITIERGIWR